MLLEILKSKAVERGLLAPNEQIGLEKAFLLVRDMPYVRASSRVPETIIQEWRGTCSGKHYLLKRLFAELGYSSRLIACTTVVHIDPNQAPEQLRELLEQSNGRFVDVHNYLILELPDQEMIVDATWPLATKGTGTVVNESFVLGENQQIACEPIRTWVVPEDSDAQEFKNQILKDTFTPEELAHRDEFIKTLGSMSSNM
jgi:arylamine N-acetyltransferase